MTSSRITAVFLSLALACPALVAAADIAPVAVPPGLEAPGGVQPFLHLKAEGTQNYVCTAGPTGFTWTFTGPQATLFDQADLQVTTHFLSPSPAEGGAARATWQHSADTSRVWATAVASSTDASFVAPGAIPWLLLRVTADRPGPTGGAALVGTTYIQRVNTAGGVAPSTGCKRAEDIGTRALVPYETDYVFFR